MRLFVSVIMIFMGGGFGSLGRYGIFVLLSGLDRFAAFPFSTVVVNLIACFFSGIMSGTVFFMPQLDSRIKLLIVIGFLGGLGTFTSVSVQFLALWEVNWIKALLYMIPINLFGVLFSLMGLILMRWIHLIWPF